MGYGLGGRGRPVKLAFGIESVLDVWPELVEIHRQHWFETEAYRHGQPFAPSCERYHRFEQIGWYILFTARDGSKLVGNLGVYLSPSMHTQQLIATEDTLFLLPDYRRGRNAVDFMEYAEAECWRRGAVELTVTAKNDRVGRLLVMLAYEPVSVQYSKQRKGADSAVGSTSAVKDTPHVCSESA